MLSALVLSVSYGAALWSHSPAASEHKSAQTSSLYGTITRNGRSGGPATPPPPTPALSNWYPKRYRLCSLRCLRPLRTPVHQYCLRCLAKLFSCTVYLRSLPQRCWGLNMGPSAGKTCTVPALPCELIEFWNSFFAIVCLYWWMMQSLFSYLS